MYIYYKKNYVHVLYEKQQYTKQNNNKNSIQNKTTTTTKTIIILLPTHDSITVYTKLFDSEDIFWTCHNDLA